MANRALYPTTQEKADAYDSFHEVFSHLYKELKALGSKKSAETLSKSKVKMINRDAEFYSLSTQIFLHNFESFIRDLSD